MWWNVGVRNARYNSKQILYYLRKYMKVPTCTQTATIRPNISVADDVFYKVVIFLSDDKKVFLHCGPRGHGFLIDRRATAMYRSHDISRTGLANPRWYYGNSHITVKYYILTYPKYHISQNTAFFFYYNHPIRLFITNRWQWRAFRWRKTSTEKYQMDKTGHCTWFNVEEKS